MSPARDLDPHTYKVIIQKLTEAGWDNPELRKKYNDTPVDWLDAELSHRVQRLTYGQAADLGIALPAVDFPANVDPDADYVFSPEED